MKTMFVMPSRSGKLRYDSSIQHTTGCIIDDLIDALPDPKDLTADARRGIIARYTAVLEGNFIYWMTAALLSVGSQEASSIMLENLNEEVRDAHPAMLRRFAIAAHAFPTKEDALAVHEELTDVRMFFGRLSGIQSVLTMAFLEGYIQKFMVYLANLAESQGSVETEYTDVHGLCDIEHTYGLFRALELEIAINPPTAEQDILEGVFILRTLLQAIVHPTGAKNSANPSQSFS